MNLQEKLSQSLLTVHGDQQLTLGDMFVPKSASEDQVRLPMWVANATIIQNSQLFQFTPDVLSQYQVTHYIHQNKIVRAHDHDNALYGFDIPAGVGMKASAAFPYAIAGSTLWSAGCDEHCYLQLFDGGLVDTKVSEFSPQHVGRILVGDHKISSVGNPVAVVVNQFRYQHVNIGVVGTAVVNNVGVGDSKNDFGDSVSYRNTIIVEGETGHSRHRLTWQSIAMIDMSLNPVSDIS